MNGWLIALTIIAGIAVLFLLLLFLGTVRIRVSCKGDLRVTLSLLGIRFRTVTGFGKKEEELRDPAHCNPDKLLKKEQKRLQKEREKAERKRRKEAEKRLRKREKAASGKPMPTPNLKENLEMILALVKKAYDLTKGKISIRFRRMHLSVGTDDAAQTAILYGVVVQSASYLLEWIETHFTHIRRKPGDMTVEPDFETGKTSADIDLLLKVRIFTALRVFFGMLDAYRVEKRRARRKAAKRLLRKRNKATPESLL